MPEEQLFKNVRYLVFDVDGVFTDNSILVTEEGQYLRSFSMRDGYAIKKAIAAGLGIAVITGGAGLGVVKRFKSLGVDLVFPGVQAKAPVFHRLIDQQQWPVDEVLYMGDDEPDLECLKLAGYSVCPADAVPAVLSICDFATRSKGGANCVRELIETLLRERDLW